MKASVAVAVAVLGAGLVPSSAAAPTLTTTQGCDGGGAAHIAWGRLSNPILSYPTTGVRDIGVRLVAGTWHLAFTAVTGDAPDWHVAMATSRDWSSWASPTVWSPQPGTKGLASPDVTRRPDGTYVVTYQSDPGETGPPGEDKLYYRTSPDMVRWSAPHRLMPTLHAAPDERLIDAALAWTDHGLILGYKFGLKDGAQHFEIAWSPSGAVDGPWTFVGRPNIRVYGDTIENYQFLRIDGRWHLLATSNNLDRPWLFALRGDASTPSGWLDWDGGRELEVPAEAWNRAVGIPSVNFELANSAYLCDARRIDGWFYLFYVGTNELRTFGGWGHTKLGVARSRDLILWSVPCRGGVSTPLGCI